MDFIDKCYNSGNNPKGGCMKLTLSNIQLEAVNPLDILTLCVTKNIEVSELAAILIRSLDEVYLGRKTFEICTSDEVGIHWPEKPDVINSAAIKGDLNLCLPQHLDGLLRYAMYNSRFLIPGAPSTVLMTVPLYYNSTAYVLTLGKERFGNFYVDILLFRSNIGPTQPMIFTKSF